MKRTKVIGLFLLALTVSVWAGGNTATTRTQPSTTQTPRVAGVDLSGLNVVVGNWWDDWDVNTRKPASAEEERTLEWRRKIQNDYNFKMREANIAGWAEMQELASTSIMAGSPMASIFVLQPNWALALYNQSLFYPVSDTGVDFSSTSPVEWNQAVKDTFTFNGKVYAFAVGYGTSQHGSGVYFNKRIFQEAGIDPALPYDMQKAGTWTWDAFLDLCKRLTRDINNDGIIDTYALTADLSNDILETVVASNGAQYVDKDATGKFINATGKPEFLQALQYCVQLKNEGVLMPRPADSEWNWYQPMFHDGRVAMRVSAQYVAGELGDMADDWGFVLFPKGPNVSDYKYSEDENVYVIPRTFSAADANKIMQAFILWSTPAPGNDGPDAWKAGQYSRYRDARAVDETLELMRNPSRSMMKYATLIPGLNTGDIAWNMWNEGQDPAQLIESVSQSWNSIINEANRIQ
ncbi:MAG: extracellular solute-binding protein [Treponema sp.]|jgi:ABC-type glycerol-3-phosphate transport system substrate-binding protein|nr:extracellular solute-binding protein [Treponema sp.]